MSLDNFVDQTGRLTRDPESRQAGSSTVTNFAIAVDKSYKNKDGEWINKAIFTEWQAWNGVGNSIAERAHKGDLIRLQGEYDLNEWTDQEGVVRRTPRFTAIAWKLVSKVNRKEVETDEVEEKPSVKPKRGRPTKTEKVKQPEPSDDNEEETDDIPF